MATCDHLSDATWHDNCSGTVTEATVGPSVNGGQRRSTMASDVTLPDTLFRWGCYRLVSRAKVIENQHFTVTYTSISIDYEEPSGVGSPGVVVYGYDGLPMHPPSPDYVLGPEHPPSPDYVSGPEHPPSPVYVPYVPEPGYPEFMPPEDDVFPAEEQPLPVAVSPTADLPGYITESDSEEDPEEEDDEDPEEDPADYPTDRDEEEEDESSGDDADDEEEDEGEDEEEEEEHLASVDSVPPP
ncbi:hypothetical protein Tco_0183412 [Tanacetum coccineum]